MLEAVSDTGPLIHLDEIRQLNLLTDVFAHIYIPEHVVREVSNTAVHAFILQNPDSISIEKVQPQSLFSAKEASAGFRLHLADLAVMVVLYNYNNAIAITDNMELRQRIESSGKTVIGTVGMLFRAYKQGTIDGDVLRNLVDQLFNDSSLYLSSAFKKKILSMIPTRRLSHV